MKPERKENKFYKAVNLLSDYLASKGTDEYKNVLISDLIDGFNGSLLSLERVQCSNCSNLGANSLAQTIQATIG